MADDKIFRKKSLDKISSPDQLDKYIKSVSPSVIILFIAVAVLVIGLVVWGFVGKIETKSNVGFTAYKPEGSQYNVTITYIKEDDYNKYLKDTKLEDIQKNMFMQFDDVKLEITLVNPTPQEATIETKYQYLLHAAGISIGEWYYAVYSGTQYEVDPTIAFNNGKIVYKYVSPVTLLFS